MYNYLKIKKAVKKHFKTGDEIFYKDIVRIAQQEYPEIKKDCILPSDLCDNHKNKDPFAGKHHVFHKLGIGRYEVL